MIDLIGVRPDLKALAYTGVGHTIGRRPPLNSVVETPLIAFTSAAITRQARLTYAHLPSFVIVTKA